MAAPRPHRASKFKRVWETIVPSTTGKVSRVLPSRRASTSARAGLAQAGRQRGGHKDTDERCPHGRSAASTAQAGRRDAQNRVPGQRAGEHRGAHQPQGSPPTRPGREARRPRQDPVESDPRPARTAPPAGRAATATAGRPCATSPARAWRSSAGAQARQARQTRLGRDLRGAGRPTRAPAPHGQAPQARRSRPDGDGALIAVDDFAGNPRPGEALGALAGAARPSARAAPGPGRDP